MVRINAKCGCKGTELYEVRHIPGGVWGDPFDASCNLQITGETAEVSLLFPTFHAKMWRSIKAFCQALDVKEVTYTHNGKQKIVRV